MGVSEFLMKIEIICKNAPLWCQHVHLAVEMIFINRLECQRHHFARLLSITFELLIVLLSYICSPTKNAFSEGVHI